jgi:hypothetical protein
MRVFHWIMVAGTTLAMGPIGEAGLAAHGKRENSSSGTPFLAVRTTGETPVPQFCRGLLGVDPGIVATRGWPDNLRGASARGRWPSSGGGFAGPGARSRQSKAEATRITVRRAVSAKESAQMRRRAREAIKAGELDQATKFLRRSAGVKKRSERRAWLLLAAELGHAKGEHAEAALAAMRLVILHPKCDRVGAALFWAGRSYEGLRRPHKAIELYDQCLSRKDTGSSVRKRAKARLAIVRKKVP